MTTLASMSRLVHHMNTASGETAKGHLVQALNHLVAAAHFLGVVSAETPVSGDFGSQVSDLAIELGRIHAQLEQAISDLTTVTVRGFTTGRQVS